MSGHQLARALRSDSRLDATWLVALSGYALPEDLVESARADFDVHLAKPLVDGQLERLLGACARPRARQGRNP
jgi:CheY-like chemotaxis protein